MSSNALKAAATGKPLATMSPKQQVAHLLQSRQAEIQKLLPKHLNPERLLKIAQVAATTTPGLLECEIPSLIGSIGQCAQMGLEPNTVLGHAYLTPFKAKVKDGRGGEQWVKRVQVIIGYKGLIDLARRSGQIVSIAAHEVRSNDHFELEYGLQEKLSHRPCLAGDRGELTGFYAVAQLKGGGHAFEFMSLADVKAIMVKSQSKGAYGPWKDHFVEMGRKTVIRRLAKYLPLSVEFQTAAALDEMADAGRDQRMETIDGEFMVLPDDEVPAVEQEADDVVQAQPRPAALPEPTLPPVVVQQHVTQVQAQPVAAQAAGDDWEPSAEELAEIHKRELEEAGMAQPQQQPQARAAAPAQSTARRGRAPAGAGFQGSLE